MSTTSFSQDEYDLAYPTGVENHYWTRSRISILTKTLKKNSLSEKKILEIGCGKGIVVHALRKLSFNCCGVELANVPPLEEVNNFVTCHQDALLLNKDFRDTIEVILLLDVIEHIENAELFLKAIKNGFVNTTHFIIMVPARKELWSNYDEFYKHFRRYTLEATEQLAKSCNLILISHRYFFHALYFAGLIQLVIFRKRSIQVNAPKGIMILLHKFLAGFFLAEDVLISSKVPGSSIVAVYKTQ